MSRIRLTIAAGCVLLTCLLLPAAGDGKAAPPEPEAIEPPSRATGGTVARIVAPTFARVRPNTRRCR